MFRKISVGLPQRRPGARHQAKLRLHGYQPQGRRRCRHPRPHLEFGFPMQSKVLIVPAGKEFRGTLPDGGKGLAYTSRYGLVGANALGLPVILDGLNDQGLSVGLFYFPGYANYTP